MMSTVQVGQVKAARENWDNVVNPLKDKVAAGGSAKPMVDAQSTWAANHGIETLTAAESFIEGIVVLRAQLRDAGVEPKF